MSSKFSSSILSESVGVDRPTANYHPSLWRDHFLTFASLNPAIDGNTEQEWEELKEKVRNMLTSTTTEKLCLIDDLQRLGVSYHFEKEIEDALEKLYNHHNNYHQGDLHTVSLLFRLLRQQGFHIPCGVFKKFIDEHGKFKEAIANDVVGMLSLYEASHLAIHGEQILDEALAFTTTHLKSMLDHNHQLSDQITHALNRPIRRNLPRLETLYSINHYHANKNPTLLKFAKLDFNKLQLQHRKELSIITAWWRKIDVKTNFTYARDRIVECYFWIMGAYFEPHYMLARKILTKVIATTSIIDDTYDAYGTLEELQLLTDAIERWDIKAIDDLPEYMKLLYSSLLDVYNEAKEELSKEGRSYCVDYAIQEMKIASKAFLLEAKWLNEKYVPKYEEYLETALVSSAYAILIVTSFLGMGKIANKEGFEWSCNPRPKIIRASTIICRLMDDLVSHEFEQKRPHVESAVQCYMKQYGVSEEEVIKLFNLEISKAWKDINQEFLKPTAVPVPILTRALNLCRVVDVLYKVEDGYTNSAAIKDSIEAILLKPFLL